VSHKRRRTKIVCTIGPASSSPEMVRALVDAGMDGARLNFSHGTHQEHAERARLVREAQEVSGRPIALIADLQGPKLRVGDLAEPRELEVGEEVIVAGEGSGLPADLPVAPPVLSQVIHAGHEVVIDDGLVRLRVERVDGGRAECRVVIGGVVAGHKGVNLPGVAVPVPSLTAKDVFDLELVLQLDVDFIALSFVRSVEDVRLLREHLHEAGAQTRVIAKIEKAEALRDLSAIIEASDAVMVARGDLGVEVGAEEVPLYQKRIIQSALEHGKPAITATQMLESMLARPEPTRAEASDVANAILDGTAAVMLSGETAVGRYPVQSVRAMDRDRDRAVGRLPSRARPHRRAAVSDRGRRDLERCLRHCGAPVGRGDPRPDLLRKDRLRRRSAPAAAAHRGCVAPFSRTPADGDRVGCRPLSDRGGTRRRAPMDTHARGGAALRRRLTGRPSCDHRRHGDQRAGDDEPHQGRDGLAGSLRPDVEEKTPMPRRAKPPSARIRVLRWLGVAVVLAIAIAYVQPIRAYLGAKDRVAEREAQKAALLRRQAVLLDELQRAGTDEFVEREARRLGLVRPGELLFIVSGVEKSSDDGLP
jgi:pyruvate kinase